MINTQNDTSTVAIIKFCLQANQQIAILDTTVPLTDILGLTATEAINDLSLIWAFIPIEDRQNILIKLADSAQTMQPLIMGWRVLHPEKGEIFVDCKALPVSNEDNGVFWNGYLQNITELKQLTQTNQRHLRFQECLKQVNEAIQNIHDLDQLMSEALKAVVTCFQCDRAWLIYPCDPESSSWRITIEQTHPDYPSVFSPGIDCAMKKEVAMAMKAYIASDEPIISTSVSESLSVPLISKHDQVHSVMGTAISPQTCKPWLIELHHFSNPQQWSHHDNFLFGEISQRLSDGLSRILMYREQRENEECFRQAFEFAAIGMGILSLSGKWLRANHSIYEMFGYSEAELLKMTYQEMTHPEDLQKGKNNIERLIADEIPYMKVEKRYRHRNGHYLWTRLTTSIVRDGSHQPLYFVSQIENIEDHKQSEQSIALLNFAINQVRECIYLLDKKGRIKYANDEACHTVGYSRTELLKMTVPDLDPNVQHEDWKMHWEDIRKGRSVRLETLHKTKAGNIIPIEVNANYFEYDDIGYNLALTHDITERKR